MANSFNPPKKENLTTKEQAERLRRWRERMYEGDASTPKTRGKKTKQEGN